MMYTSHSGWLPKMTSAFKGVSVLVPDLTRRWPRPELGYGQNGDGDLTNKKIGFMWFYVV